MTKQGSEGTHHESGEPPLRGVRILDLTHMLAGPYATMLLADLGAEVIKIEPPHGEFIRGAGPTYGEPDEEFGGYFQSVNRNKRSLPIDLRSPEGIDLFLELVDSADALVENFRVGTMEALGLGWETLHERNPQLVYGCIRGFGDPRTGRSPYVDWPAYDIVAQAMGGFMTVNGFPDREPVKSGVGVGDIFPAALLDIGLLAAVMQAKTTGRGRFIDVAMYDAMISLAERNVYQHGITGEIPQRIGNNHPLFAPFGVFETKDGWITIAAPNNREWSVLAPLIDRPELVADERFAKPQQRGRNAHLLRGAIEAWTRERTNDEIVSILGGKVPVGPVQSAADIAADPHVAARNMIVNVEQPGTDRTVPIAGTPIRFSPSTAQQTTRAPRLGEHSESILNGLGIDPYRVQHLMERGVVGSQSEDAEYDSSLTSPTRPSTP